MRSTSTLCLLSLWVAPTVAAQDETSGVIVAVGDLDASRTVAAAEDVGGAQWRLETIAPAPPDDATSVADALDELAAFYQEGDFPRCLTRLQDRELDSGELLAAGQLDDAAALAVASAACTIGAGDPDRGRELFRRAFLAELDLSQRLASMRPDMQALADEARADVTSRQRVLLRIEAPEHAEIRVDGRPLSCRSPPCETRVYPGEHVVSLRALGRLPRVERLTVSENMTSSLAMDGASPGMAQRQLSEALHGGTDPESLTFVRGAADAYGARVVVVLRQRDSRTRAAIFDRARGRIDARQSMPSGPDAAATLVRNVTLEWLGEIETGPGWWIWAVVGGSLALATITTLVLVVPLLTSHSFVFQIE